MTRAEWYARNRGGGWRTARKMHRCDCASIGGLRCLKEIPRNTLYFDTNDSNGTMHLKKRFCADCANSQAGV